MVLTGRRLTADEFLALPPDEYRFAQLIDGEIVVTEALLRHQRITVFIARRLMEWTEADPGRGEAGIPVDVVLDERNVFAPDVWWVSEEHRLGRDAPRFYGPPDLAVEVRSPSTWRYDTGAKKETYERLGLPELWLVDSKTEVVAVHRRSSSGVETFDETLELGHGETLTSSLLPGFSLSIDALFDR